MNPIGMGPASTVRFEGGRKRLKRAQRPFSQQELEAAVQQMQAERAKEANDSGRVAKQFETLLGIKGVQVEDAQDPWGNKRFGYPWNNPAKPVTYRLVIQYSQYDAGPAGYIDAMKKIPGTKILPAATDPKRKDHENVYEWDISGINAFADIQQKVFPVRFSFYDAHVGGY